MESQGAGEGIKERRAGSLRLDKAVLPTAMGHDNKEDDILTKDEKFESTSGSDIEELRSIYFESSDSSRIANPQPKSFDENSGSNVNFDKHDENNLSNVDFDKLSGIELGFVENISPEVDYDDKKLNSTDKNANLTDNIDKIANSTDNVDKIANPDSEKLHIVSNINHKESNPVVSHINQQHTETRTKIVKLHYQADDKLAEELKSLNNSLNNPNTDKSGTSDKPSPTDDSIKLDKPTDDSIKLDKPTDGNIKLDKPTDVTKSQDSLPRVPRKRGRPKKALVGASKKKKKEDHGDENDNDNVQSRPRSSRRAHKMTTQDTPLLETGKYKMKIDRKKLIYITEFNSDSDNSFSDYTMGSPAARYASVTPESTRLASITPETRGGKRSSDSEIGSIDDGIQERTTAIVTGYPLEAGPPLKVQREALWKKPPIVGRKPGARPVGRPRKKPVAAPVSRDATPDFRLLGQVSDPVDVDTNHVKKELDKGLVVGLPQHMSSLRQGVAAVPKEGSQQYVKIRVPTEKRSLNYGAVAQLEKAGITMSPPRKRGRKSKVKKLKSVSGAAFGFGGPVDLSGMPRKVNPPEAVVDNNDDFCSACGEPGSFLCCEGCPKSFHFSCLDPPLDEAELPDDDWYCDQCTARKYKDVLPVPRGIFGKLLASLQKRNPHRFELPKQLRERYAHVTTGKYGEYQDSDTKALKTVQKGVLQQFEPMQSYDKDGKPFFCYKCGGSGLNGRELAKCEYCPLIWHLDCLDPPLSSAKLLGTKWKCPNHVDDLVPRKQKQLRKPIVLHTALSTGFENKGDVDIWNDQSSVDYFGQRAKKEDSIYGASGAASVSTKKPTDSDDDIPRYIEPEAFKFRISEYFTTEDSPGGLVAPIPKELQHNFNNDEEIVYKVPEAGIIKTFASKIKDDRIHEINSFNQKTMAALDQLACLADQNHTSDAQDKIAAIKNLFSFQTQQPREKPHCDFNDFVKIALQNAQTPQVEVNIDSAEIEELRNLKKLMLSKGKDKLLNFLKS